MALTDIIALFNFNQRRNFIDEDFIWPSPISLPGAKKKDIKFKGDKRIRYFVKEGDNEEDFFFTDGSVSIIIFGAVFLNGNASCINKVFASRASAQDIHSLYSNFRTGLTDYVKGNFVIIIFDERLINIVLISSRLNSLPLFYHYRENCLLFSSSVRMVLSLPNVSNSINKKAFIEQLLFFYPLGGKTFFRDVFQLEPASILCAGLSGLRLEKYWHLENAVGGNIHHTGGDAIDECVSLMRKNMKMYTGDAQKFLLSLTGGFDGRLNLALIDRDKKDFLCYSYGAAGSQQICIPQAIAKERGFNYRPVYLDRAFEDSFEECALKAIDYTDGTASITRANLVYAFENLSYFSKINISGLGGSELIKPVYKANMQVSRETFELLCADNFDKKFKNAFKKVKALNYLKPDVIESFTEEIKEDFKRNYIKGLSGHDRLIKFYVFLIQESWRKYLMQEMRMVRPYVETRTPYFDEDFVELIFRTPFAGIYNGATKKNPFLRRNGLSFYGKLIHKLSPELGRFITDRGYRPSDIILPFWLKAVKVTPHYVKNKLNRIIRGDDTFRPWPWSRNMLRKYIYSIGREDELFTDSLIRDFENKPNLEKNFRFYSIFSFRLWSSLFLKN